MDQEELNRLAQQTDPDNLGASLEKKKEEKVEEMSARDKAAAQIAEDRKQKAARRVGIRTYRDFAADELKKGGGTLTKMIVQEREKEREQKRHSVKNTKNLAISFLAILFIVAGIGIVALSFILVTQTQNKQEQKDGFIVAPKPLILSDFRKELYIKSPTRSKIVRAVQKDIEDTAIPVGSIKHVYIVQDSEEDPKELLATGSFFRAIESQIPSTLSRALDPIFMYGSYSSVEVAPFLLFTSSSYSNAYSGLLEWEDDMVRDLESLFVADLSDVSRGRFEDLVLYNIDVRALLDSQGEVVFGYGFLQDKRTIVFFDNRLTLREIITRSQKNTIKE